MIDDHSEYMIRRKILSILGAKFHVYDSNGDLIAFCKQKAFKLKEDIRIYSDESMAEEIVVIQARNIVDFGAAYDVIDSRKEEKVGALRRKGFKSLLRDSWEFLGTDDEPIARLQEDSMLLATVRRFLSNLVPQTYHVTPLDQADGEGPHLVTYKQFFNPFVYKLQVSVDREAVDPRLALAAGILLAAIEGRQKN